MNDQLWRASVGRWGDQLWALALVRMGDRVAAQQALVQAFERVYTAKTLPADAHAALVASLAQPRQQWLPRWGPRRALPRSLRRMSPADRALIFLWLVQESDGHRLAAATHQTHHALMERLAKALVPFLPRRDPARRTTAGRAAFAQWIGQQLGSNPVLLPTTPADETWQGWQAAVDRVRDLLAAAVAQQRLPGTVRDAIETALTAQADETPAWQRRSGWLALALLAVALVWMLRPGADARTDAGTAQATPTDARTIVQAAIDGWTTTPVTGTLHRRVWAVDPNIRNAPALITDVWLQADGARHRIEATHDGKLVEWQVGDGAAALHYAANPLYRTCHWGANTVDTNRAALLFKVDAAQQQAARDARLQHGAYGRGYQMLQTALHAPDLRSWGTRIEGDLPVLLVGYNDPAVPQRQRVLVFDARTHALQAVRELAGGGTQTTAHDLWRVEHDEHLAAAVSTVLPERPRIQFERSEIFDPACLGLDDEHVLSLRTLVGIDTWWLPTRLPPDIQAAALLSNDSVTPTTTQSWPYQPINATAVFVGGERWLRIKAQQTFVSLDGRVQRGAWRVVFDHDGHSLRAELCRPPDGSTACPADQPSVALEAHGWTEAQLVELIDGFAPAGVPTTWRTLDALFIDPRPLDPQVQQVLAQTLDALDVPDGVVRSTLEITQSVLPGLQINGGPAQPPQLGADANPVPPLLDPYAVPHTMLEPPRVVVTETVIMSDSVVDQMSETTGLPDGTLLHARLLHQENVVSYDGLGQTMVTQSLEQQGWLRQTMRLQVLDRVQGFVRSVLPITLRDGGDVWLLEQPTPVLNPYTSDVFVARPLGNWREEADIFTERLWIDKHTHAIRRAEVVYADPTGVETAVSGMSVLAWQVARSAAPQRLDLPQLPPDTISYTYGPTSPTVTSDVQQFMPPQRVLVWRDGFEVAWRSASNRPLDVLRGVQSDAFLKELLVNTQYSADQFAQLEASGAIHSTSYRVGESAAQFVVRQGSAPLMRFVLRTQSLGYTGNSGWTKSRAVPVTIIGQERTAWLLQGDGAPALVVEVDGVILHITSSEPGYVSNDLINALPQIEWIDVAQWQGNS